MKKYFTFVLMAIMIASCNTTTHVSNSNHPQSDKEYWYNVNFNAGNEFFSRKKWRKAEKAFKKAAEYKKDFAVNYNIALSAYQRENYQDAINYFNASLRYNHNQIQEDKAQSMLEKSRVARQQQIQRRQAIAQAITVAVVAGATATASAAVQSSTGVPLTDPHYGCHASGGSSCSVSSSSSTSSSYVSSSNNSTTATRKKCGFCGGRGWNVEYTAGYGLATSEYCSTCGKNMMSNHYHATCQKCGGTGYEK